MIDIKYQIPDVKITGPSHSRLLYIVQVVDNEICAVLSLLISSDGFPPIVPVGRRPSHPLCELCPAICPRGQEI